MDVSEAQRLKVLEDENGNLKKRKRCFDPTLISLSLFWVSIVLLDEGLRSVVRQKVVFSGRRIRRTIL